MRALQLGVLFFHLETAFFYAGYLNTGEWETEEDREWKKKNGEKKKRRGKKRNWEWQSEIKNKKERSREQIILSALEEIMTVKF